MTIFTKISKKQQGFTLIELIMVIAVLGILAGIAIPRLSGIQAKARFATGETLLANMETPLELYRQETDNYPNNGAGAEGYSDLQSALTGEDGYLESMNNLLPETSSEDWNFESYSSDGSTYSLEITHPNTDQNLEMTPSGVNKVEDN